MRERKMEKLAMEERDRISKLPDFILHYILSFLEPEEAFSAACLSKLWLNVWSTYPNITFSFYPDDLPEKYDKFEKFVENTISRFSKSELSVHSVRNNVVHKSYNRSRYPSSLLEKSIRFAVEKHAKIHHVDCFMGTIELYSLPETIFAAKSLIELQLRHCNFDDMNMFSARKFEL